MIYVALLRGINVGGKQRVEMQKLKSVFESLELSKVRTYINSGNVIFEYNEDKPTELVTKIEISIKKAFSFPVRVVLRDINAIRAIVDKIPDSWVNDGATMKTDVMFLWPGYDKPDILNTLSFKPAIEDVVYVAGAIVWRVDRKNITRSSATKLIGTPVYQHITIRNINTVRKIYDIMTSL